MSSFSPYLYKIPEFKALPYLASTTVDSYEDIFTFLSKPQQRNTYKISLAQIVHNLIEFGIGYGSVCSAVVDVEQHFLYGRYVNRHNTTDNRRPATVADLKDKIRPIIISMIEHTIKYDGSNKGVKSFNTIYPKYMFTLDTKLTPSKLKKLTNRDYVEDETFKDFAYSANQSYDIISYQDGYIPVTDGLYMVPKHTHVLDGESIWYEYSASLKPSGKKIVRTDRMAGHNMFGVGEQKYGDSGIGINGIKVQGVETGSPKSGDVKTSLTIPWTYPDDMECEENEKQDPVGARIIDGENRITIRYPGRRYRLFRLKEDGNQTEFDETKSIKILDPNTGNEVTGFTVSAN